MPLVLPCSPYTHSIIGRAIVIHDPTGKRISCGTIKVEDQPLSGARAHFKKGLSGNVTFVQPSNNYYADTIIFMDLEPAEADAAATDNQQAAAAAAPAAPAATTAQAKEEVSKDVPFLVKDGEMDFYIYDGKCDDAEAKLLNPDNFKTCTPDSTTPFMPCALGDLSGRHGMFTLPISGDKAVFINDYVPLNGPNSIIGKSLVIQGGGEKYCANIIASKTATRMFS